MLQVMASFNQQHELPGGASLLPQQSQLQQQRPAQQQQPVQPQQRHPSQQQQQPPPQALQQPAASQPQVCSAYSLLSAATVCLASMLGCSRTAGATSAPALCACISSSPRDMTPAPICA